MAFILSLWGILDANKLTDPNYMDWLRNLRIVLAQKKIFDILNSPNPDPIREDATKEERIIYKM